MKHVIIITLISVFFPLSVFSKDVWKFVEEIENNGSISTKSTIVTEDIMKTENESSGGKIETIMILKEDRVINIDHRSKTYQFIKLSKLVEYSEQLMEELKKMSRVDPDKVIPQISFEKKGESKVGEWDCEEWIVKVDGKIYNQVWVAPALKNLTANEFRMKFKDILPESLLKYRSIDSKIEDHFIKIGMIVKSRNIPSNKKMTLRTKTVKLIEPLNVKTVSYTIPDGYENKSSPEDIETQKSETKKN